MYLYVEISWVRFMRRDDYRGQVYSVGYNEKDAVAVNRNALTNYYTIV